jgi:translocation protein SEC66
MPEELSSNHIKLLKVQLLKRAVVDVQRVFSLREDRSTLALLLRNGAIGDDLWNEFNDAESEINLEIQDCIRDAEELEKGWGQSIFQQAAQLLAQEQQRELDEVLYFVMSSEYPSFV